MLAATRPDDWDLSLVVHVGGAMLLVGALVVAVGVMAGALRRGEDAAALTGLAFRALLLGVLPSYVVMRAARSGSRRRRGSATATWRGSGSATRRPTAGCWSRSSRRCSRGAPGAAAADRAEPVARSSCCPPCC